MFSSTMFYVDPKTKTLIGEAANLGIVRGHSAIFEMFEEDVFGLKLFMKDGSSGLFRVKEQIQGGDRLTTVLVPYKKEIPVLVGHKMIVLSRVH